MSMMRCDGCDGCDAYVDTDFNVEGVFEDASPFRYWCDRCIETAAKNQNEPLLAALKVQAPEMYAEMMEV